MIFAEHVKNKLSSLIHKMAIAPWLFSKNPEVDFSRNRKLTADLGLTLRGSERPGLTGKRFFCISVSTSGGEMSFRRK